MSAVSVTHSPTRWLADQQRRKPMATATTTVAPAPQQPAAANTTNTISTGTQATGAVPKLTVNAMMSGGGGQGDGRGEGVTAVETTAKVRNGTSSRISFAPGTTFYNRSGVRSRGPSQKVPANFHRPITPGDKPHTPQLRFKIPKATLPTLHYLSVSKEDFMDPRYAENIVKTYGIPRYFFKSKSNFLASSAGKTKSRSGFDCLQTTDGTYPDGVKQRESVALEKEAEDARPKTSDPFGGARPLSKPLPIIVPAAATNSPATRSSSARPDDKDGQGVNAGSMRPAYPGVAPVYKPLIGEKYTHARFYPPHNPYRSLQMESEVTKYVEHKKRVGLGRYVQFVDPDTIPTSAFLREASMYDLNHDGPIDRPLDQFLPPPERKPFIRQRPRDPKNDFVRSADDRSLVIMSRERTATDKNSLIPNDVVRL